jgi:hypothetical protein
VLSTMINCIRGINVMVCFLELDPHGPGEPFCSRMTITSKPNHPFQTATEIPLVV